MDEAARRFANALTASYRAFSEGAAGAAQEKKPSAQLTQEFFKAVINNLRTSGPEGTRALAQRLSGEQQPASKEVEEGEGAREVTHASEDIYVDFLDSMFVFYRASVKAAERGAGLEG